MPPFGLYDQVKVESFCTTKLQIFEKKFEPFCCYSCLKLKIQFLIFGHKIIVTWLGSPNFGTSWALVDTCIMWKFQVSMSCHFGVIRKRVKIWTQSQKNC